MSVKNLLDLSGRVAVVTGGSRGLGLQIATGLGEMGAKLALVARNETELAQAKAALASQGIAAIAITADLARFDSIPATVDAILEHCGQVDILVNNAGGGWVSPAETHPLEAWQDVMNINVTAAFRFSQEIGRRSMLPRAYGRIINIASIAAMLGNPPQVLRAVAYNASKGALVSFTRALAVEWAAHGITVNAICPGFFPTPMSQGMIDAHGGMMKAVTPNGRLGGEEDLKGLAVLLASDAGRHIVGQAIAVDGGVSIV